MDQRGLGIHVLLVSLPYNTEGQHLSASGTDLPEGSSKSDFSSLSRSVGDFSLMSSQASWGLSFSHVDF